MPNNFGGDQFDPAYTGEDNVPMNAIERLKDLNDRVNAMRAEMRESAKEAIAEGTKVIFAEYGDLVAQFGWTQYTPYFNDGDPCEFGMGELSLIAIEDLEDLRAETEYDLDDQYERQCAFADNDWNYGGSPSFSTYRGKVSKMVGWPEAPNADFDQRYADAYEACRAVYNICGSDGQKIAKDIFGDHVTVTFTSEGVDVEEYEHE